MDATLRIGDLMRRAQALGMSHSEIAECTGRDRSTVWRWANGRCGRCLLDEGVGRLIARLEELERKESDGHVVPHDARVAVDGAKPVPVGLER